MNIHRRHFSYLIGAFALGVLKEDAFAKAVAENPEGKSKASPSNSTGGSKTRLENGSSANGLSISEHNRDKLGIKSRAPVCEGKDMNALQVTATDTRRPPSHLGVEAGGYCKEDFSGPLAYDSETLVDKTIRCLQTIRDANDAIPKGIRDSEFACVGFTNIDLSSAGVCVTGNGDVIVYRGVGLSAGPEGTLGFAYPDANTYLSGESYSGTIPMAGAGGVGLGFNSDSVAIMIQFSATKMVVPSASFTYGEQQKDIGESFKDLVKDLERGARSW